MNIFKRLGREVEKGLKTVANHAPKLALAIAENHPLGQAALDIIGIKDSELNTAKLSADDIRKLKEFEKAHETDLLKLENEAYIVQLNDVQNSREMLKALDNSSSWLNQHAQVVQSVLINVGFFAGLYFIFTLSLTETQENLLHFMLGVLSNQFVAVNSFWFGSSRGSQTKDSQTTLQLLKK